jgi:hypothetical protein
VGKLSAALVESYTAQGGVVALPGARAASRKGNIVTICERGREHVGSELTSEAADVACGPGALFGHRGGLALLTRNGIVLWEALPGAPRVLRFESALEGDSMGRHREPLCAVSAGARSVWVLLTRHASGVESDAWIQVEFDDHRARWVGEPRRLAWSEIPKQPIGLAGNSAPFLQSLAPDAEGRLRVYHTSTEIGSLGGARYGWAWSLLVIVDGDGHAGECVEVAGGYGFPASDGTTFLVRAGRGNKLHFYDLRGREIGALALTPRLVGEKTFVQRVDLHGSDLWLNTPQGIRHVSVRGLTGC